jgi:hypothetical protein
MALLEDRGVARGTTGWKGTIGGFSAEGQQISALDSGGRGGEVKIAIDYPSVQFLVRGDAGTGGYIAAYEKAKEVFNTLTGIETPNPVWDELVSCVAVNQPAWLGRDDRDRPRFSVNFRLITEPTEVGNRTY